MESLLVTLLIGCFLVVIVPAALLPLLDAAALDPAAGTVPTPFTPATSVDLGDAADQIAA